MEHMRWNQDIPDSLFSVDIPPGYTKIELPQPSEEYLIKALKVCAELSNGGFPPELESAKLVQFYQAHRPDMINFRPEHMGIPSITPEPDEATKAQGRIIVVGSHFVDELEETAVWRYFGSNVRYGDSNAVLLCWRPKDATNWRVIYGDLSVKGVAPDQMPPVPATVP